MELHSVGRESKLPVLS